MTIYKLLLAPLTVALPLMLASCATSSPANVRNATERPKAAALRLQPKKELSTLNLSLDISARELRDTVDLFLPRELLNTPFGTSGLSAQILRNGPVAATVLENRLRFAVPVSISLVYGSIQTIPVPTTLKFTFEPKITADWRIHANVFYTGMSEQLPEDIKVGPLRLKPRKIVETMTAPLQSILSDAVNRNLNERLPLKAEVVKVWNSCRTPIRLEKNQDVWLVVAPEEVLLNQVEIANDKVNVSIGLKGFTEVVVGAEPPLREPLPLPDLKPANRGDRTFRLSLHTDVSYREILHLVKPMLLGKEFSHDGDRVILIDLDISGNGENLAIRIETTGSVNGIFNLTCRPAFSPVNGVLSVQDLDFDMQSRNILAHASDWLLHGTICAMIQEKLNLYLTERLEEARRLAAKRVSRVPLTKTVILASKVKSVRIRDVMVQKDRILLEITTEGDTAVSLR